jgi:hypothetical protein
MKAHEQLTVPGLFSLFQSLLGRLGPSGAAMFRSVAIVGAIIALAGCATGAATKVRQIDRLESVGEHPRILIMEPDIKYYLLTVSGVPEPHAEWTAAARRNFASAVKAYADERGTEVIMITDSNEPGSAEIEYSKLHAAVGLTIQSNYYSQVSLPSKEGEFDLGLGPGVAEIGEKYNADYALFSYYRDYQASGGRVAFAVLAAVAGVGLSMGQEQGFASLVDLKTGDIVWFNIVDMGAGELRDEEGAVTAVAKLFENLPER